MIQTIVLKKTDTLLGEELKIDFSEKTNIIIGPKGGGKSTLFDLLAGLKEKFISDNVISALKEFKLEFVYAKTFNNEIIRRNNLDVLKKKEKELNFQKRNDVIFQDDPIKKNLNSFADIDKEKMNFVKEELPISKDVNTFIDQIENFYTGMQRLADKNRSSNINWSNTFYVKDTISNSEKIIISLNYNIININNEIKLITKRLKSILENIKNYKDVLENNKLKEWTNQIIEKDFKNNLLTSIENSLKENLNLKNIIKKELKRIKRKKLFIESFKYAYKKEMDIIKKENKDNSSIESYLIKSQDHFKDIANEVKKQKELFDQITLKDLSLVFKNKIKTSKSLSYKMPEEFILNSEKIYKILKIVLPTPGSAVSDLRKWLEAIIKKGIKKWDYNKILNSISKMIKEEVEVIANGKNYEHMSLGQKSIYGIEYKFNKSKDSSIFLDQPEDNLDNYTIATNILKMINDKKNQIFIVTHNANIGILTNPNVVVVADLNDHNNPYYEGTIEKTEKKDSVSAHFLEGGTVYLKQRYEKIQGVNNDIKNK